jgi:hypothetical protein
MDDAPIFKLDFICPSCNSHSSVYERTTEIVEDKIDSFELFSWEYDEDEDETITDVQDCGLDVQTTRVNSYGTNSAIEWFCANCDYSLPVDSRGELFMWLYNNKMLIPT